MNKNHWIALAMGSLFSTLPHNALAWGDDGHEIVGLIADHFLDPAVRTQVNAMLAADTSGLVTPIDIAHEATWADKFRDSDRNTTKVRYNETHNWHFVDIEIASPNIDTACFGHPAVPAGTVASNAASDDCVVDKITEFTAELKDPSTPAGERLLALQFLLHFVGDVHQPLHSSDENDQGGNAKKVHSGTLGSGNLHGFWDTQFVHMLGTDDATIANTLASAVTPAQQSQWEQEGPSDWAMDAFALAKSVGYGRLAAPDSSGVYQLDASYADAASKVVAGQLSRAGVRLAHTLNQALGGTVSPPPPPTGGTQLLGDPGFENGADAPAPWAASSGVISNDSTEPARSGQWVAWLDGYGKARTDTLQQAVSIPPGAKSVALTFWLHIDTDETSKTKAYDTLKVQVLRSSGTVLKTLATVSNLNAAADYVQYDFDLSAYAGTSVTLKFTGKENKSKQTSFVIDDVSLSAQ